MSNIATDPGPPPKDNTGSLRRIASGRRAVNSCLLLWLATAAFRLTEVPMAGLVVLGLFVVSVAVSFRLCNELVQDRARWALFTVGMLVPVGNFLVMGVLSSGASRELRRAGYR